MPAILLRDNFILKGSQMKIKISVIELEPGEHIMRKTVAKISESIVEIPDAECKEVRPDWGEYLPVVTFPAITWALKKRGLMPFLTNRNHSYQIGIA